MKAYETVVLDEVRGSMADLFKQQLRQLINSMVDSNQNKKSSSDQVFQASAIIDQRDESEREKGSKEGTIIRRLSITKPLYHRSPDYSPLKQVNEGANENAKAVNEQVVGISSCASGGSSYPAGG